jgi:hypothetical protein
MAVFWVIALCSLLDVYRRLQRACCLHHQPLGLLVALMMEAASASEMPVNFYQTTRRNDTEDSHLHTRRRENLRSHNLRKFEIFKRNKQLNE